MVVVTILLTALALSMDAFAVSVCKGLATREARVSHMCIAGAWFGGFQALMPLIGYFLGAAFKDFITAVDHWIAFALLVLIGVNMLREAFSKEECCECERDQNASYGVTTMLTMAIATSIDAFAVGITFALSDIPIFWAVLAIAMVVIFQPELRRAFAQLGSYSFWRGKRQREVISEIVAAAIEMARRKCGALIVIERRIGLRALEDDAVKLDCKINASLLQSIFYPNSPLHDGAVVIRDNRIVAARAILPLPRGKVDLPDRVGTRHRAAIGISEETDAVVVVVSEETGIISISTRGILKRDLLPEQLEEALRQLIMEHHTPDDVELAEREE